MNTGLSRDILRLSPSTPSILSLLLACLGRPRERTATVVLTGHVAHVDMSRRFGETRWAQKQLISATIFARPGRAAVSSKPDARDTVKWLSMPVYGLIDRPRATLQRCCSAGACEVSPFYTSLFWLRHSLFSAQVRCCRRPGE